MRPYCPACHNPIEGLATYCHHCKEYVDNLLSIQGAVARGPDAVRDTRSEDERKRDAREAVEALGWTVWDHEQGWRRDNCPSCNAKIPGGHSTRVPRGWPDWVVTGHGHTVFVEWKTDTNDLTAHQKDVQAQMARDGVPYFVCRNTEDALRALTYIRRIVA